MAHGAAMVGLARLGALIEVVAQPVYTWLFGIATYGLYIVLLAAANLAEKIVDLSLTTALQRIVPVGDEAAAHGAVKFALLVTVIPATIIATIVSLTAPELAGYLSAAPEDEATLPLLVIIVAWILPLWTFVEITTAAVRARRAFGPEVRLRLFWEQFARLLFAVGLFAAGATSTGLVLAHLLSLLLVAGLSVRLLGRYYDLALIVRAPMPAPLRKDLLLSGIALSPSALTRRVLNDLPPILLNLVLPAAQGATAAGLFGIARKVASVPLIVRQTFLYVLAPLSAAQASIDRAELAPLYRFAARLSGALAVPIGALIIILATDILSLFGPGAEAALGALVFLTIGRVIEALFGPATPIVETTGHRILPLVNSAIGILVWLVLAILLTPEMGAEGMAIAVGAGAAAIAFAATAELWLSDGLAPFDQGFVRSILASVACCVLMAAVHTLAFPLGAAAQALATGIVALPLIWLTLRLGLDLADRKGLGSFGQRIGLV